MMKKLDEFDINFQFGMRVRFLRKKAKLTIEELSFRSNISKNYLGDLERGTRNPTLSVIKKIADGLEINLEELFEGL